MTKQNRKAQLFLLLIVAIALSTTAAGCKKKQQPHTAQPDPTAQSSDWHQHQNEPVTERSTETAVNKPTLAEIVARARYWGPEYIPWYGKEAPDFTLTDLDGKQHRLSDYRGKNVMLIFWATWCKPCIIEIPHLVELRHIIGEDKLAMLAISHIGPMNSEQIIRSFAEEHNDINYTVIAANPADLPTPFSQINAIPSSFFITPAGKIKLATVGLLTLPDMKAIIEAEK